MLDELCRLLIAAAGIIRRQAALLMMHGIDTEDGKLESDEFDILAQIREAVGEDGAAQDARDSGADSKGTARKKKR